MCAYQVFGTDRIVGEMAEGGCLLHSSRAAPPVTVVDVELFALEDKCADAILGGEMKGQQVGVEMEEP